MAQTAQSAVEEWFAAIGTAPDYKTMHYWAGAGQSTFDINFAGGYISREHVKAFIRNDTTGASTPVTLTFQTASRVSTPSPVPVGSTICIYRDTPKNAPLALFVDGAILNAVNLDRNAKQSVFAVAELLDRFDATNSMAEEAILRASEAKAAAESAAADAASAEAKVAIAQSAATAAEASAQSAASLAGTANSNASTALSVANGIDAKATEALSKSGQAVAIATDAEAVANGIDAKATTALSQSSAAVATANTAMTTANQAKATADGVDAKATDAQTKVNTILGSGISLRNMLINGDFRVNQRTSGQTASTVGGFKFVADRWLLWSQGAAVSFVTSDVNGIPHKKAMHIIGSAGNTEAVLSQRIESLNCDLEVGQKITLSMYVYCSAAKTVYIGIDFLKTKDSFATGSTSISKDGFQIPARTWTKISTTATVTAECRTNGMLVFAYQDGGVKLSEDFYITGAQLERGSEITQFENRPYGLELLLCQRYYQTFGGHGAAGGTDKLDIQGTFNPEMRGAPSISFANITSSAWFLGIGPKNITAITNIWFPATTKTVGVSMSVSSGASVGVVGGVHPNGLIADAEL